MPVSFKLAMSANAFTRFSPAEAVAAVKALGYDGIELMFDEPHFPERGIDPPRVAAVQRALTEQGLAVSNVNAFTMRLAGDTWHPSWIEPEEPQRRARVEHTVAAIRLASRVAARSISTEPGGPVPPGVSREAALRAFHEGIARVVPFAGNANVLVLVEPEPGLLLETSDQFLEFARRSPSPLVALNFDVGHFFCVGEDPAAAFRKLRPYVRHVHLEDIASNREHRHLIPGTGAIDLGGVLRAMAEAHYAGFVTVELYPYQDDPAAAGRQALEHLRGLIRDL